jgi:hypothetical protein
MTVDKVFRFRFRVARRSKVQAESSVAVRELDINERKKHS